MIKPPPSPADYADRGLDCQMALEDEFQRLAERAEAAGWKGGEVAGALLALSTAHIKARIEQTMKRAIRAARDSVGEHN